MTTIYIARNGRVLERWGWRSKAGWTIFEGPNDAAVGIPKEEGHTDPHAAANVALGQINELAHDLAEFVAGIARKEQTE